MKIAGLGLINILTLFVIFVILIVGVKAILVKHPVKGLSEIVQAV